MCLVTDSSLAFFLITWILVKAMSKIFCGPYAKGFEDSVKERYFLRFHNSSTNIIMNNISEESCSNTEFFWSVFSRIWTYWGDLHAFFISTPFISKHQAEIGNKIKQKLNNTLRLSFCCLKCLYFLRSCYYPKLIWDILRNVQKRVCLC